LRKIDPALAHRLFYPDVPAILSASSGGSVSAMPVVSFASLSEKPPLIGVSCAPKSFTLRLALASRAFSLCLLDKKHVESMDYLASRSGSEGGDKLEASGLRHRRGKKVPAPVISESVAALECSLRSTEKLGDHILLVGQVEAAYASGDFREYWRFRSYDPILYAGWKGRLTTYGSVKRRT